MNLNVQVNETQNICIGHSKYHYGVVYEIFL